MRRGDGGRGAGTDAGGGGSAGRRCARGEGRLWGRLASDWAKKGRRTMGAGTKRGIGQKGIRTRDAEQAPQRFASPFLPRPTNYIFQRADLAALEHSMFSVRTTSVLKESASKSASGPLSSSSPPIARSSAERQRPPVEEHPIQAAALNIRDPKGQGEGSITTPTLPSYSAPLPNHPSESPPESPTQAP